MCTALDTIWIGLASGHIMVFSMNPVSPGGLPGELLTYFKPYKSFIRFLAAANYPGPCQKEECMMISGGKMYQPDDSFQELPDFARKDENGQPVDTAGVAILWEVLPARYMRQVHYLSEGTSYLNYSRLEETMTDTGFTESIKSCPSASPTTVAENGVHEKNAHNQPVAQQSSRKTQPEPRSASLLRGDSTMSTISNGLSGLVVDENQIEQLLVEVVNGRQLQMTCEPPFTLKSVLSKIAEEAQVKGNFLITYQNSKDMITIETPEQFDHYLKLPNRPNLHVQLLD